MNVCNYLKELRAFVVTCQQGNMSKASEVLFTSQPTMSLQIKKLESELNVQLFERQGPKLVVTQEGQTLYQLALPLVQGFDHLQEEFIAQQSDLTRGKLSIAAEESTMLYTLADPIVQFLDKYPGVRLNLVTVRGTTAVEQVTTNEVDMAVVSLLDVPKNLSFTPFVSYSPVLLTPLDHPLAQKQSVSLADIQGCDFILPPSQGSSGRLLKMLFGINRVNYNVVIEAGGWEVIKKYVSLGLGVTVATQICISEKDKENIAIIPLEKQYPERHFGVLTRKNALISLSAQRFIEILYRCYHYNPTD